MSGQYPVDTALVIVSLYPDADPSDWEVVVFPDGTADITLWQLPYPKPTPQEVIGALGAVRLESAITRRISALEREVETHIDEQNKPYTRAMLHAGILKPEVAEDVRELISASYEAVNEAKDAIEAAVDASEVDAVVVIWPIYQGNAQ